MHLELSINRWRVGLEKKGILLTYLSRQRRMKRWQRLKRQLRKIAQHLQNLLIYQKTYIETSVADTSAFNKLNELLHFDIDQATITGWDTEYTRADDKWKQRTPYWMNLPGAKPDSTNAGMVVFSIGKFSSDMQFAEKYPGVGTWVLLILIFCSFCFVTIATSVYTNAQTLKFFSER